MVVWGYEHGTDGVSLSCDPDPARQHTTDYVKGREVVLKKAAAGRPPTKPGGMQQERR